ncbi:MAG: hypothetical protein KatS3mg102_2822 [Planctomycetota bacterium]|nr:MAG: hypothetical protein KatS3mg102_2822 [Planctomycetota bacterium]
MRNAGRQRSSGRRGRERGSALIVTTVLVGIAMVFAAATLAHTGAKASYIEGHIRSTRAFYAAEAGLEEVKYRVRSSAYDAQGNIWLRNNSSPGGTHAIAALAVGAATVDVWIYELGTGWHRVEATGRAGSETFRLAMEVTDRDPFSRYMFFTHLDDINFGTSTVRGDVHSNRRVNFYYGGAVMYGNVTASRGIGFYSGASWQNTTFFKEVDGSVAPIPWPKTSEIATLKQDAEGPYKVSNDSPFYQGLGNFRTELELLGDLVRIRTRRASTGQVLTDATYPLPANGLIYVEGPITSLKGDIAGRLTIATLDRVDITGKIRYVDADGDPAYLLYRYGEPVPGGDTPPGVAWSAAAGYSYEQNPAYDPAVPSTLGIMALNDITVTSAAPYNMELHAAIFSSQGNWHCDLSQRKGNLRVVGSMTQKLGGWRYDSRGYGWAQSGEYIYDEALLTHPPAFFLEAKTPVFASWRRGA